MTDHEQFYRGFNRGDGLVSGEQLKIERMIFHQGVPPDLADLITLPAEKIQAMREKSATAEQRVFDQLRDSAKAWETHAARTQTFDMALEYLQTPQTEHSANQWVEDEYNYHSISNMVYKMNYRVYEDTKYDWETQKYVPVAWEVTWDVHTNEPSKQQYYRNVGVKIAGQDRKRFKDKGQMQKYLAGRIKANAHLFTEISPPIPTEHARLFQVNGQLLPGYGVEGEQKPSLNDTLTQNAKRSKAQFPAQSPSGKLAELVV